MRAYMTKGAAMNLTQELSEFNRRMVGELQGTFAPSVSPFQTEYGTLVFRGPIEGHKDPKHVGTHVSVELDSEVHDALASAEPDAKEEMMEALMANLGTQVRTQYNPRRIGEYALRVRGSIRTITA